LHSVSQTSDEPNLAAALPQDQQLIRIAIHSRLPKKILASNTSKTPFRLQIRIHEYELIGIFSPAERLGSAYDAVATCPVR